MTSKRVARVFQHQLSFLFSIDNHSLLPVRELLSVEKFTMETAVFQGFVLGPLLFVTLYSCQFHVTSELRPEPCRVRKMSGEGGYLVLIYN